MENLTSEEENAIINFQTLMIKDLPPEMLEDKILFYKFLKARNFNLEQAESMLRKNIRWRKAMQVSSIQKDFKPQQDLTKYASHKFLGFDKEGCPIKYFAMGNVDSFGLLKSTNSLNILRYTMRDIEFDCELFKSQSKKLGRPVTRIIVIYDMKNFSLATATHRKSLEIFRNMVTILQDNYPEHIKATFLINASVYVAMAFSFIKAVLANELLKKIHVFSEVGWKEELRKVIDDDVLPDFCGGNCTDPDGNLGFKNIFGVSIPASYYLKKDVEEMARREGSKYLKVERRRAVKIPLKIQKPRSLLHWEFLIKDQDIGFGLMLDSPDEESVVELIPVHQLETEVEPECGFFRCEKAGDYKMVFDNTHSWFNSKELFYRTWMTDDEEN